MQFVYSFDHEHERPPREFADLLGGKGANLAEMTSVLHLPVPPGFTVSTAACMATLRRREAGMPGWPEGLEAEIEHQLDTLEQRMGRRLGDGADPLLVSVRSGARFSMPGMMDTVLNLGLNDTTVLTLAELSGDVAFAHRSYARLLSMYAKVVRGLDTSAADEMVDVAREREGVGDDARLSAAAWQQICERLRSLIDADGRPLPQDPREQLREAVDAVFSSWNGARAVAYRRREHIADDLGTAVNVQAMVFGNRDDRSGTGVAFTRNAATGENRPYGDFLVNAQGEDVVAGVRRTEPLDAVAGHFPEQHRELLDHLRTLEAHYRDMLDVEFTIEQERLWMLQTRVGKRSGVAALRMAVEMTTDDHIRLTHSEAVQRITPDHLDGVLHPRLERRDEPLLTTGLAASPGAAVGPAVFSADEAVRRAAAGRPAILVRRETSPEDVHGMLAAAGVLTERGGLVSHAAVVARGWGTPAVVGADELQVGTDSMRVGDVVVREGDVIAIDGSSGAVVLGDVAVRPATPPPEFDTVLAWADTIRSGHLSIRANADTAEDAEHARQLGAEGIGLCRTEHMFLREDRLPALRRMILADDDAAEQRALAELHADQRQDFADLLEAMDGLPVTVRLLDPPLHEFLPDLGELERADAAGTLDEHGRSLLDAARRWAEKNPMLGIRGVRLAVLKPGLYTMQVRALLDAVRNRVAHGGRPVVEVMIPLTVSRAEFELARSWVTAAAEELGVTSTLLIGTMIETPRAALVADQLAGVADFFSFGTNDLTQLTFGFSRDDVEARLMPEYLRLGLIESDPFASIDRDGVGALVAEAVRRARSVKQRLTIGVCGEHGGDPASIAFLLSAGVDYVSCSPYRVPIARLAAAHAVVGVGGDTR